MTRGDIERDAILVAQATEAQSRLEDRVGIPEIDRYIHAGDLQAAEECAVLAEATLRKLVAEMDNPDARIGLSLINIAILNARARLRFELFKAQKSPEKIR